MIATPRISVRFERSRSLHFLYSFAPNTEAIKTLTPILKPQNTELVTSTTEDVAEVAASPMEPSHCPAIAVLIISKAWESREEKIIGIENKKNALYILPLVRSFIMPTCTLSICPKAPSL